MNSLHIANTMQRNVQLSFASFSLLVILVDLTMLVIVSWSGVCDNKLNVTDVLHSEGERGKEAGRGRGVAPQSRGVERK